MSVRNGSVVHAEYNERSMSTALGESSSGISGLDDILLLSFGQSNERGQVPVTDRAANPQIFQSLRNKSFVTPINGIISTGSGNWWHRVYDRLFDQGFNMHMINMARGSMSFTKELAGQVQFRNNNTGYDQLRNSIGKGDFGYFGDLIVMGGKLFQATVGRRRYLQYDGNTRIPNTTLSKIDYRVIDGAEVTAASDPGGWAAVPLGGTNIDGGITWTCIDATNSVGYANGQVLGPSSIGLGFDPANILADGIARANAVPGIKDKYVYLCNAQSDTGNLQSWYYNALVNISTYCLDRGFKVIIGLSCYNASGNNIAGYDTLSAARVDALAALSATYPNRVFPGANLYQLMGSTGNMGAGGAWLQADNIHLSALGNYPAGDFVADSILNAITLSRAAGY